MVAGRETYYLLEVSLCVRSFGRCQSTYFTAKKYRISDGDRNQNCTGNDHTRYLYTIHGIPVSGMPHSYKKNAFLDGVYRYDKVPILHFSQRKGRRGGVNFSQGHRIVHLATSTTGTKRKITLQHTVLLFLSLLEFTYCNKDQNVRG